MFILRKKELKLYDEGYLEYHARKARKDLDELVSKSDSELIKLLEGIHEEEMMRALGYTKKEGNNNETNHNALR